MKQSFVLNSSNIDGEVEECRRRWRERFDWSQSFLHCKSLCSTPTWKINVRSRTSAFSIFTVSEIRSTTSFTCHRGWHTLNTENLSFIVYVGRCVSMKKEEPIKTKGWDFFLNSKKKKIQSVSRLKKVENRREMCLDEKKRNSSPHFPSFRRRKCLNFTFFPPERLQFPP